jgi:hypothetical protein
MRGAKGGQKVAKPKGLKPDAMAAGRLSRPKPQARRPDMAEVNIRGRFRGQAGKRMDAQIDRAVKEVEAWNRRGMKSKQQVKKDAKRLKSLRAAHESDIIAGIKRKNNKPTAEIRSFLRGRAPSQEIALIRRWVGEKRGDVDLLRSRRSRSRTKRS